MKFVVDLRGLERTMLLVWELQELADVALERGELDTAYALGRALTRFCADGDPDRATVAPIEDLAELELQADESEE